MTQEYLNQGGVQRVTINHGGDPSNLNAANTAHQQEKDAGKFQPSASKVGDARSIVTGGAQTADGSFRTFTHDPNPVSTGDILATARTASGSPVTRELRPDDTVDVGGQRTSVRATVAAGFLVKDGSGYRQVGRAAENNTDSTQPQEQLDRSLQAQRQAQQDDQQRQADNDKLPDLEPTAHKFTQEFTGKIDNVTLTAGTRAMMETGSLSEDQVNTAATQLGIAPDEVKERAQLVHDQFLDQARSLIGNGADVIFDWARQNAPEMLKDAVTNHVYGAKADAYDALAREYWKNLARTNPQAILSMHNAKDVGARIEPNGVLTALVEGAGRMAFAAAINGGFTNIGKRK
jgi:hypothetical protein